MGDLPAMRHSADNVLALSLFFLFFADFVHSAICFYNAFPNGYVWGELFIKYTDGPVRRGLTGYLLYKSAAFLNIHVFWTLFVSTVYMLFFIRAYTFIRSSVSYFFTIILFFSPALLAFLVKDPELYGRKDILFLGLLTIIIAKAGAIIIAPEKQGKAWLTIALCYLVAFLVHEITLFFSLLPALLVLRAGGRHRLPVLAAIGSVFLLSVLFAVHFQGTETMREAMFRDWQALIPDFTTQGGMRFIGKDLSSHATPFPWLQNYSLRLSYIAAWLLALLPLGLLLYVYRFHRVCSAVLGRSMTWLAYGCALFPAVALTFTINDFGRTISYSCLMFLFFVLHILRIYRDANGDLPVRPCFTKLHFANTPVLIGSLYYLLCWKLYHYVPLSMEPRIISLSF